MAQRAASLKQYAYAWEPLYKTLDDKQKARLRFVTMATVHEARDWIAEETQLGVLNRDPIRVRLSELAESKRLVLRG
ncbi:hypothetical protein M2281_003907 [Mesorhizobium soli]|uniref:hypothetical protein n=1 Tax=Pseudaminobacter soli (ex Li et al. 2025) TaxID=1295366 RepID=UPI00247504E8|nr:hypothetical protein [Mesorhizobium soli]MDH6233296.1 hypothetical protein [Mesorhizobium soli]